MSGGSAAWRLSGSLRLGRWFLPPVLGTARDRLRRSGCSAEGGRAGTIFATGSGWRGSIGTDIGCLRVRLEPTS